MISPFDPMVKAMLGSYQQAVSKGMPPEQAAVYVKSGAQQGVAPFVDLPAMLRQFERLKQEPIPQPQTPTIREQIEGLSRMSNRGLGAIRPGTPRPPMADPMQRGIGAMDAGSMENPQGFASGGIVAFDQGGVSNSASPIVAANLPKPRSDQERYDYLASIFGQGYVPAYQKEREVLDKIEKEEGIGEYAKSLEEEADLLKTQETRSLEELMQDKANLRRQEAADIAGASVGSRSLLEAMAKSRSTAVSRERELEKEIRKARDEREKARIGLTKAKETAVTTKSAAARTRVDKYQDKLDETEKTLNDRLFEREKLDKQIEGQIRVANIEMSGRENIARLESALRMGLQERAGQIELDIKRGTASTEDKLGWRYMQLLETKGEDDPDTKAAFERYSAAMGLRSSRSTAAPIDLSQAQGGAPAAGSNVRNQADAILAGG
jgi:hypothetical protein